MEDVMTAEDRWNAQRIPDEYLAGSGDSISRISRIVTVNWWQHGAASLSQLVEPLLGILEPLEDSGREISNEDRDQCRLVVAKWLADH